jgi:uncharacterized protein (TIGR00725 family)
MDTMNKDIKHGHRNIKICVAGATDTTHCGPDVLDQAKKLGGEIARAGAILLMGANSGFQLWVAMGAKEAGGIVIGFSPAANEREHQEVYKLPVDYMDLIIYTGFGFAGRDLLLVRSSDAVICGCGRIGTISEFTMAFEDEKPLGVFEGPWETDEILKDIVAQSRIRYGKIVATEDPAKMTSEIIKLAKQDKIKE